MRARILRGFSLMEMMVVLLIVAIIAAASAPMVTKKLSRSAGTNDSPWVFTGLNNSIAYNMNGNDNTSAIIGSADVNRSAGQPMPKLYIESSGNEPQLGFGSRGQEGYVSLLFDRINNRVAFSDAATIPANSVAIGTSQSINAALTDIIALGTNLTIRQPSGGGAWKREGAIAIGRNITIEPNNGIAIGFDIGDNTDSSRDGIMIGHDISPSNGVAIGANGWLTHPMFAEANSVAIGSSASAEGWHSVAIGTTVRASGISSTNGRAIAIGHETEATNTGAIAIGNGAAASGQNSIALSDATASHNNSVAIGNGAQTTAADQIVLGDENTTVYIPGTLQIENLEVAGVLVSRGDMLFTGKAWFRDGHRWNDGKQRYTTVGLSDINLGTNDGPFGSAIPYSKVMTQSGPKFIYSTEEQIIQSDRRLKNIGEKYTAGLAELKKLDFFHFTFKQDEEKTPHVGVIAQDLQKVFPDAVTKGEDGYLRIRWEDMFYAVINAVKELDNKITEIVQNITDINSTIEKQNKTIEEQQKTIDELVKRIEKLEKQK